MSYKLKTFQREFLLTRKLLDCGHALRDVIYPVVEDHVLYKRLPDKPSDRVSSDYLRMWNVGKDGSKTPKNFQIHDDDKEVPCAFGFVQDFRNKSDPYLGGFKRWILPPVLNIASAMNITTDKLLEHIINVRDSDGKSAMEALFPILQHLEFVSYVKWFRNLCIGFIIYSKVTLSHKDRKWYWFDILYTSFLIDVEGKQWVEDQKKKHNLGDRYVDDGKTLRHHGHIRLIDEVPVIIFSPLTAIIDPLCDKVLTYRNGEKRRAAHRGQKVEESKDGPFEVKLVDLDHVLDTHEDEFWVMLPSEHSIDEKLTALKTVLSNSTLWKFQPLLQSIDGCMYVKYFRKTYIGTQDGILVTLRDQSMLRTIAQGIEDLVQACKNRSQMGYDPVVCIPHVKQLHRLFKKLFSRKEFQLPTVFLLMVHCLLERKVPIQTLKASNRNNKMGINTHFHCFKKCLFDVRFEPKFSLFLSKFVRDGVLLSWREDWPDGIPTFVTLPEETPDADKIPLDLRIEPYGYGSALNKETVFQKALSDIGLVFDGEIKEYLFGIRSAQRRKVEKKQYHTVKKPMRTYSGKKNGSMWKNNNRRERGRGKGKSYNSSRIRNNRGGRNRGGFNRRGRGKRNDYNNKNNSRRGRSDNRRMRGRGNRNRVSDTRSQYSNNSRSSANSNSNVSQPFLKKVRPRHRTTAIVKIDERSDERYKPLDYSKQKVPEINYY